MDCDIPNKKKSRIKEYKTLCSMCFQPDGLLLGNTFKSAFKFCKNPRSSKRLISKQQNQKGILQKANLGEFGSFLLDFMIKQKIHGVSFCKTNEGFIPSFGHLAYDTVFHITIIKTTTTNVRLQDNAKMQNIASKDILPSPSL